jgi:hypothetical protein
MAVRRWRLRHRSGAGPPVSRSRHLSWGIAPDGFLGPGGRRRGATSGGLRQAAADRGHGSGPREAPGEPVAFDGTGSRAGERPIGRWLWDFYDGSGGEGQTASHSFAKPGRYVVTLRVEDDSAPPCNFGTAQQIVRVNARPVAVAGEDQRLSVGQTLTLDGQRSYDVDGKITGYQWDLGDGTSKEGASVDHAYAAPGTYTATLTVEDDAGVANSRSSDSAQIVVNAPPVAEAGPDRHVATGEVITLMPAPRAIRTAA